MMILNTVTAQITPVTSGKTQKVNDSSSTDQSTTELIYFVGNSTCLKETIGIYNIINEFLISVQICHFSHV